MIHVRIKGNDAQLHPKFLYEDFDNDEDALCDFLGNLHDDECSIIALHGNNLDKLKALKMRADHDVESTAKALAME